MRRLFTILISLLFVTSGVLKAQEVTDSVVLLVNAKSAQLIEKDGESFRKVVGPATFFHNNTYLLCDTALWNVNTQIINAIGNVHLIQESTELRSESLDYLIDQDLAQFRGQVVELRDDENNVLRTRHLDYNTKDSVAVFENGAAMRDKDGQLIESNHGSYDSKSKLFTFLEDVNMFTDSIFVKTSRILYNSDKNMAYFGRGTDVWKKDNMLSANDGWYDRGRELFFFRDKVHIMTSKQEGWSDSLYYYSLTNDVDMIGNAELLDTTRNVFSLAGFVEYRDSLKRIRLYRRPAVVSIDEREDTVYVGADTLICRSIRKCDIDSLEYVAADKRLSDIAGDPVMEYRRKAAEAAAKAAEAAAANDPNRMAKEAAERAKNAPKADGPEGRPQKGPEGGAAPRLGEKAAPAGSSDAPAGLGDAPVGSGDAPAGLERGAPAGLGGKSARGLDSLGAAFGLDSTRFARGVDSLGAAFGLDSTRLSRGVDSLGAAFSLDSARLSRGLDSARFSRGVDSLGAARGIDSTHLSHGVDSLSLSAGIDSLLPPRDTLIAPLDTTEVDFVWAKRNVKLFRKDIQLSCDSLLYNGLDSLVRMYRNPLVFNEGNRQYAADSIFVVIKEGAVEKASLMSNAFITIQEDENCYDQIRGAEMLAYFDSTTALTRFDALGGAAALFYLTENDALATVNKVEAKMMYATFVEGNIDMMYYFEAAKSDAYPTAQMKDADREIKGFVWSPEKRPTGKKDITDYVPRRSERYSYLARPHAKYTQTKKYFPGYMSRIYSEIRVRDSLERVNASRREAARSKNIPDTAAFLEPSLTGADSLSASAHIPAPADSLISPKDSISLSDSSALVPARQDSLALEAARQDSLKLASMTPEELLEYEQQRLKEEKARLKEEKAAMKAAEKAAKAAAKAEKQAALEAKWAEEDRLAEEKEAQKAMEKMRKKLDRERKRREKVKARQDREDRLLEEYLNYWRRKKEEEKQ